ncbi:hypothetical protein DSO57_1001633 [Entomophthora muscae]|uniref:Uncharacterized protein n=1 Tax=Entomophthora muscae TaxID=34485 RepID=A0ACC2S022_9FUNG|nr:hypothetical protein DSO57_1001633 [Entomophthora muscae]
MLQQLLFLIIETVNLWNELILVVLFGAMDKDVIVKEFFHLHCINLEPYSIAAEDWNRCISLNVWVVVLQSVLSCNHILAKTTHDEPRELNFNAPHYHQEDLGLMSACHSPGVICMYGLEKSGYRLNLI